MSAHASQAFISIAHCTDSEDLAGRSPTLPASVKTLRTQETSDPRHFATSTDISGKFGTNAEVSYRHFGIKEDTSAPGNTGPSHGNVDGCACIIT